MRPDPQSPEVDEYLWPLTGDFSAINWQALSEELRIRERLAEILAHVRAMHVEPRLRRSGPRPSAALLRALTEGIVDGPESAPPWQQQLKGSVPRALREEWTRLAQELREVEERRSRPPAADR